MTMFLLFGILIALIAIGIPVAYVLGFVSIIGLVFVSGFANLPSLAHTYFETLNSFILIAVPLYILMSNLLLEGKVSEKLFVAASRVLARTPGGVGLATLVGCGAFAAMCGSSVATTSAIGTVAMPELEKRGYPKRFSAGLTATGGTLGILIPPSIPLLLYGAITNVSIGDLFMAGVMPGILTIFLFGLYVLYVGFTNRSIAPETATSLRAQVSAVLISLPGILTIAIVLGGIYGGFFTPTEAAAVGVAWALIVGLLVYRTLSPALIYKALLNTAQTSAMLLFIIIGAHALGFVATMLRVPQELTAFIATIEVDVWVTLLMMSVLFLILGMFLDPISVISITVPILFPVILLYEINPIWFAILMMKNMELANITPPIGMNVFVVKGLDKRLTTRDAFIAVIPFAILDLIALLLLFFFPQISLWLPTLMR
ncbi:TRAP transporter large permease [Aurantimonas sp. C2-6-R+9]|uniref:TRAP transporter large permease n=1 Tax=unclassified Aurantimonas TaxID=2638230 RepID=UPI002E186C57|nr:MULTISPECIES: TRAP transporter large permease [unclassified Aurantimonas]MEC5293277.1 TRAP transporter large permease [Aurantimonas sp. C2-3-R2]MEC5383412.1 TRAP transporter large permease [Aurantimonas sp. C2-6-R+9]MEC5414370.1 TRAP transporter large permease [Aurantimonas sp. C2-4-R8]